MVLNSLCSKLSIAGLKSEICHAIFENRTCKVGSFSKYDLFSIGQVKWSKEKMFVIYICIWDIFFLLGSTVFGSKSNFGGQFRQEAKTSWTFKSGSEQHQIRRVQNRCQKWGGCMLRYQNWELKSPRSDFLELSIGFLELQCKIWVGKHTFFKFLTPVLNSPDRDVLKNGFKS